MSRETLSVAAGAAALGLVAGVLLGSTWARRADSVALGTTGAGTGAATGTAPAAAPVDEAMLAARIAALEAKFERSLAALEAAKDELAAGRAGSAASSLAGAGPASAAASAPATATAPAAAATPARPGERAPGALVPWLPPEGVPLVRAWYEHRFSLGLDGPEPDASLVSCMSREFCTPHREALRRVDSELALARWLDSGGTVFGVPKPWQLAEFAKTWDGK